jgi:hypothetical protein
MTTLTVNIDNKKSEKAVKAVLDALGLTYEVQSAPDQIDRPLNKAEQHLYKNLKKSLEQIRLHQAGKIELKTIEQVLAEL